MTQEIDDIRERACKALENGASYRGSMLTDLVVVLNALDHADMELADQRKRADTAAVELVELRKVEARLTAIERRLVTIQNRVGAFDDGNDWGGPG